VALIPDAWMPVPAALAGDERSPERLYPRSAVAGERAAVTALYTAHAAAIRRFLHGLLGCPAAADDATQETFARAFRRLDTLRESERVAPWLFGIARNVSLEMRKAKRRSGQILIKGGDGGSDGDASREGADARTPEAELLGREAVRVVERALGELSEDRRAALLLRLDHGMAYEDIAGLLGWSLAKVKVEIHRARTVLREELSKYRGDRGGAR
jgi:RNA polymerase sigma-70 factor, ECF subfamily